MGKLIKWLLGLVLLLVLVVGAAIVILPMVIDPNDYKEQIVEVVKDQTGRDLEITKDLKLSVFPWLGLETGGVTLSNAEGFGDKPFAKIETLDLQVKLMPLLSKRVEVDTLVLTGLNLNLMKNKNGKTNWEDLAGEEKQQEPAEKPSAEAPQVAFKVEGIRLRKARIVWHDKQAGERYVLKKMRLVSGALEPGVSVPVKAGFTLTSNKPKLELVTDLQANVKTNEKFTHIQVSGMQINLEGKGKGLPKGGMTVGAGADIDMDTAKGLLQVAGLSVEGPEVALSGNLKVANMNDKPQVSGDIKLGKTNVKKLAALFGSKIETSDEQALTAVSADLKLSHDGKVLKIDPLNIQLDETKAQGYVHLLDPNGPVLRTKLVMDELNVDRYMPPPSEEEAASKTDKKGKKGKKAKGSPFKPLRTLDLIAEASIGKLTVSKLHMQQVVVKIVNKDGVLKAAPMDAKLYKGTFKGKTTLDVTGKRPKLHAKEDLTGIQIGPLLKDLAGEDRLLGKGNVSMDLHTVGLTEKAVRRSLRGKASFKLKNGAYKGVNLAELIRTGGGLLGGGGGKKATGKQARTDFSAMSASMKIKKGVITNNNLKAKSPLLRVTGKGKVNLKQDTINYLVTTELVASLEGQGGKGSNKLTGVAIPVRIKGKLTDPSYEPDLSGVLGSQLDTKKLKDQLGKGAGDKLKGLLGK